MFKQVLQRSFKGVSRVDHGRTQSLIRAANQKQHSLPAAYYRGGTSRAVFFKKEDLPAERHRWDAIFRAVIGSPDPSYGRQLDGLGGGISSLSKSRTIARLSVDFGSKPCSFAVLTSLDILLFEMPVISLISRYDMDVNSMRDRPNTIVQEDNAPAHAIFRREKFMITTRSSAFYGRVTHRI
ncbi:hypothetical protein VTN31DRAFT_1387 [Thermomyces dupontii]|uniref:uncharacterized protein n=1 Tax=Talaromyces thermophilus TaxID=28565 RepID=UPI003744434F